MRPCARLTLIATLRAQALDAPISWRLLLSPPDHEIHVLIDLGCQARDGVRLSTDVYLPRDGGPWPVILIRTPYGNHDAAMVAEASWFASRGYAVAIQDVRGRFDSEGEWCPWVNEIDDGRDAIDWAGTQAWSNAKLGMIGGSYCGLAQWHAAPTGSAYLKTIIPRMSPADYFLYGMNYRSGAFKLRGNLSWSVLTSARSMQNIGAGLDWDALFRHLPIMTADEAATGREIGFYRDWLRHASHDGFWQSISNYPQFAKIDIPVLQLGGWFDVHAVSTIANYEGLARFARPATHQRQKLIMGPWIHISQPEAGCGALTFGADSVLDLREVQLRWLDRWLKHIDNGADREPAVKLFVMGANSWRTAEAWPIPGTCWTSFYFASDGRANTLHGDGRLSLEPERDDAAPCDCYVYDPANPVPTLVDQDWDDRPLDYRALEARSDVLVYTSAPLAEDIEITGPVQARLFASSTARDTDWTVRLLDVHPDGAAIGLCDGILRARFRNPPAIRTGVPSEGQCRHPQAIEPGTIHEYLIEVGVTSNLFCAGHRIRVEISSSNFPRYDRNLNTDTKTAPDEIVVALQTLHHNRAHPSLIELPIVRGEVHSLAC